MTSKHIQVYYPTVGGGGGSTITLPAFTDAFGLKFNFVDSNAVPTDAASFRLNLALADSNAAPTDALKLDLRGLGDTNSAPTDSQSFLLRTWLSATTMNSTNGVTSPSNADGQNNAAVATYQSAAAGDANPRTTSALGSNIGTISFTSAVYRGWFKSVNTLVTSTTTIKVHSSSALFADITMFSNSALNTTIDHLSGDFTFDLIGAGVNTLAKLQSMQILHATSDAVAGVTPAVLTVDAGAVDIAGVF